MRYELLNQHIFESIEEMQNEATQWLWCYNDNHPHRSFCAQISVQAKAAIKPKPVRH